MKYLRLNIVIEEPTSGDHDVEELFEAYTTAVKGLLDIGICTHGVVTFDIEAESLLDAIAMSGVSYSPDPR